MVGIEAQEVEKSKTDFLNGWNWSSGSRKIKNRHWFWMLSVHHLLNGKYIHIEVN
jgi:hypothetical protein